MGLGQQRVARVVCESCLGYSASSRLCLRGMAACEGRAEKVRRKERESQPAVGRIPTSTLPPSPWLFVVLFHYRTVSTAEQDYRPGPGTAALYLDA